MTQPAPTTVWIVDDDLGFVWWLGEIFTEAGCQAVPALSCEQAVSLVNQLNVGIDLLLVNPLMPDVLGMLEILNRARPKLKIVAIGEASPALTAAIHPQAILERPSGSDSISRPGWIEKVRKLLKQLAAAAAV